VGTPNQKRTVEILGRPFTLQVTTNSMARAEVDAKLSFDEIIDFANRGAVAGVRALAFMLLVEHQRKLTIDQVGTLIDECGGAAKFLDHINGELGALFEATTPAPEDAKELGLTDRPQKAQAKSGVVGIGTGSSSRRAKSA
jgi:hypothetical protein